MEETLVAIVNAVGLALWLSTYFKKVFHIRSDDKTQPCKAPFGTQPFNSINWYSAVNTFVAEM